MSYRTTVRTTTAARLVAAGTAAASNVFPARGRELTDKEMPGLIVSTPSGISTRDAVSGGPSFSRVDQVVVECYLAQDLAAVAATPALRDEALAASLDDFEAEVIDALLCDPEWLALFASVEGIRVQQGEWTSQTETNRRRGASLITFDVKFRVVYSPPAVDQLDEIALNLDMIDPNSTPPGPDGLIDISADPVPIDQT